jgi:hypothetical protein
MPDISQINTNNVLYNLKDSFIRSVTPENAAASNKLITADDLTDNAIVGSASGETISITDSTEGRIELKIYGKSVLSSNTIVSVGSSAAIAVTCGNSSIPLTSGRPVQGVPVTAGREHNYTDSNGQGWVGDIYDSRGSKISYTALIDLGDLTWERRNGASGVRYFLASPELPIKQLPGTQNQIIYDLICTDGYTSDTGVNIYYGKTDKTISLAAGVISIYNSAYVGETVETFKTAVTGVKLLYILATPYVSASISNQDKGYLRTLRTSSDTTAISNGDSAYMEAEYFKNTANGKYLSALINDLQEQIDAINNA